MKVELNELEFFSANDILHSGMKIYSTYTGNHDDLQEIQRLFLKSNNISTEQDCLDKIISSRYAICIVPGEFATLAIKSNVDSNEMPILKIVELSIRPQFAHLGYEKGSPFAEKFDYFFKLIRESGILKNQVEERHLKYHEEDSGVTVEDILVNQLLIISSIGWFCSLIVFFGEILLYRQKQHRHDVMKIWSRPGFHFKGLINCRC